MRFRKLLGDTLTDCYEYKKALRIAVLFCIKMHLKSEMYLEPGAGIEMLMVYTA